jgi:hypothetical protein
MLENILSDINKDHDTIYTDIHNLEGFERVLLCILLSKDSRFRDLLEHQSLDPIGIEQYIKDSVDYINDIDHNLKEVEILFEFLKSVIAFRYLAIEKIGKIVAEISCFKLEKNCDKKLYNQMLIRFLKQLKLSRNDAAYILCEIYYSLKEMFMECYEIIDVLHNSRKCFVEDTEEEAILRWVNILVFHLDIHKSQFSLHETNNEVYKAQMNQKKVLLNCLQAVPYSYIEKKDLVQKFTYSCLSLLNPDTPWSSADIRSRIKSSFELDLSDIKPYLMILKCKFDGKYNTEMTLAKCGKSYQDVQEDPKTDFHDFPEIAFALCYLLESTDETCIESNIDIVLVTILRLIDDYMILNKKQGVKAIHLLIQRGVGFSSDISKVLTNALSGCLTFAEYSDFIYLVYECLIGLNRNDTEELIVVTIRVLKDLALEAKKEVSMLYWTIVEQLFRILEYQSLIFADPFSNIVEFTLTNLRDKEIILKCLDCMTMFINYTKERASLYADSFLLSLLKFKCATKLIVTEIDSSLVDELISKLLEYYDQEQLKVDLKYLKDGFPALYEALEPMK